MASYDTMKAANISSRQLLHDFVESRRGTVVCLGLIGILSIILGGLIWLAQEKDEPHQRFRDGFEMLRHQEAEWDAELLSLQLGIVPNYDAVTNAGRDVSLGLARLNTFAESEKALVSLVPAIKAYRETVAQKGRLSEQVKASYAMLRNSIGILPTAVSDAYEHSDVLAILDGANKRAADLITECLTGMVSFTTSPTPLLRDAIQGRIKATRDAAKSLSPELAEAIERILVQIEVAIRERQRSNDLLLALAAVPTGAAAESVQSQLQSLDATDAWIKSRLWELAAIVGSLLALSFIAITFAVRQEFYRLDKDNRMLQQVKENAEEQIMQSAKLSALGQMVAGITHEINTPLAYVKAVFELIKERVIEEYTMTGEAGSGESDEGAEWREELKVLLDDGLHGLEEMATLVQTMKSFSRLDKGNIESFSVEEVIESALLISRPQLKYVADVNREFDSLPHIVGSASQLRQVLLNLIMNAMDAMAALDRRGLLTLRTRVTSSDTVQIDVCDNGPGIPEENLSKIFDPFFTTKPVGKGTGMGLSICYRIIENHGGTIFVNSKPGKGTVFSLNLPRQSERFSEVPGKSAEESDSSKRSEATQRMGAA
jgi:two-component system, NtrC family, sensor kinase